MAVRNEGGQDVDYDVEPSDPGGPSGGSPVAASAGMALLFSSLGAAFTAVGCMTGLGDQGLVLAGLGLCAAGLVFQGITLDRARRLPSVAQGAARLLPDGGKKRLQNLQEHAHTFASGTRVNFWDPDTKAKLAQSPQIFNPNARVTLRRYASGTTNEGEAIVAAGAFWVEVT